jgi:hypothetical protein
MRLVHTEVVATKHDTKASDMTPDQGHIEGT